MKLVNPLGRTADAEAKLPEIAYGTCVATCMVVHNNQQANLDMARLRS